MSNNPDRIPFDHWINTQLSIARFYGACVIDGERYELDYESCDGYKDDTDPDAEGKLWKPDLVKVKK